MGKTKKPRKAYRPGPVHLNTMARATAYATRLAYTDVQQQMRIVRTALGEFARGINCVQHWRSLADMSNVAETLCDMGLGSGEEARGVVHTAQRVLHDVAQRHRTRHTWTLHAAELDALQWLLQLHQVQLDACAYGEFERALLATHNRIAQARAGNAPPGAVIVEGELA